MVFLEFAVFEAHELHISFTEGNIWKEVGLMKQSVSHKDRQQRKQRL